METFENIAFVSTRMVLTRLLSMYAYKSIFQLVLHDAIICETYLVTPWRDRFHDTLQHVTPLNVINLCRFSLQDRFRRNLKSFNFTQRLRIRVTDIDRVTPFAEPVSQRIARQASQTVPLCNTSFSNLSPGPQRGNRRPGAKWSSRAPPPPNLQIMAYVPKRVSFGIKAFKAFWGILKNKALTIWGPSEYEALG